MTGFAKPAGLRRYPIILKLFEPVVLVARVREMLNQHWSSGQ
jgi:hypothetical protein